MRIAALGSGQRNQLASAFALNASVRQVAHQAIAMDHAQDSHAREAALSFCLA